MEKQSAKLISIRITKHLLTQFQWDNGGESAISNVSAGQTRSEEEYVEYSSITWRLGIFGNSNRNFCFLDETTQSR